MLRPELIPSALNMIAALAAVLGGLFVLVYFARRFLQRPGPASPGSADPGAGLAATSASRRP